MNAEVGDLVMDLSRALGTISHIESIESKKLYFVLWFGGYLQGYSTVHEFKEIDIMRKNIKLFSLTN